MRIQTIQGPAAGATSRAKRRQPAFAMPQDEAEDATQAAGQAAPASIVFAVLGEAAPDSQPQASMSDREAARQGQAVLEALAGLQLASLGLDSRTGALAALRTGDLRASDPGLDAVLQAIAARAAVILARAPNDAAVADLP